MIKQRSQEKSREKTIFLYSTLGWKNIFAKIRFWDSPYLEVERLVPRKGKIIDLGCGEGIFSNFLAVSSLQRNIVGVDIDKKRINEANRGLLNTRFERTDVIKYDIPKSDSIILFHLLHHIRSYKDQEILIKKCVKSLKKGGRLIIVEIEPKFSVKYFITWFVDHFVVAWLFQGKFIDLNIFFRPVRDWVNLLQANGMSSQLYRFVKGKPFSHVILVCER